MSLASGSVGFLGYELSPASGCCSGAAKRIVRVRSVARTVSVRQCISSLGSDHESSLALSNRCALSIVDASVKFARSSFLGVRRTVVDTAHGTESVQRHSVSPLQCVCICADAMEKGFAFAVREWCCELPSEVGRVSERMRFKRSSRSVRARSRALIQRPLRNAQVLWRRCRVPGGRVVLPEGVSATSGLLSVGIGGLRWFLSRGRHLHS